MLAFPKPKDEKRTAADPVTTYPDGREVCNLSTKEGKLRYKHNLTLMWVAQNGKCGLMLHGECKKFPLIFLGDATFDHGIPRGMGGANRDDRPFVNGNCAACLRCNQLKGSRRKEAL